MACCQAAGFSWLLGKHSTCCLNRWINRACRTRRHSATHAYSPNQTPTHFLHRAIRSRPHEHSMSQDDIFEQTKDAYLCLIHPTRRDDAYRQEIASVIALASSVPDELVVTMIT